jgi:HPt (histidine-containing phosphotransfer) domain-containing protein
VAARLAYPARVLEEKLAALREGYRRTTLPRQLETLRALLAGAPEGGPAPAEAARLAHRVKGTAGSYGFDAVAAELGAVEAILERAGVLGSAERAALESALARAEASLAAAGEAD